MNKNLRTSVIYAGKNSFTIDLWDPTLVLTSLSPLNHLLLHNKKLTETLSPCACRHLKDSWREYRQ